MIFVGHLTIHIGSDTLRHDCVAERLNENTPICRGVCLLNLFYSLFGGYIPGGAELIPVYQICTPPGRSDCGYEVKN